MNKIIIPAFILLFFFSCKDKKTNWMDEIKKESENKKDNIAKILSESEKMDSLELKNIDLFYPIVKQKTQDYIDLSNLFANSKIDSAFKQPAIRLFNRLFIPDSLLNQAITINDSLSTTDYIEYLEKTAQLKKGTIKSIQTIDSFNVVVDSMYRAVFYLEFDKKNNSTPNLVTEVYVYPIEQIINNDTLYVKTISLGSIKDSI